MNGALTTNDSVIIVKGMNDKPTKFHVYHDGDPSVGIWGDSATVELHVYDAEHEQAIREVLTRAFTDLWDFRARVLTDADVQAEREADLRAEEYEARNEVACEEWMRER